MSVISDEVICLATGVAKEAIAILANKGATSEQVKSFFDNFRVSATNWDAKKAEQDAEVAAAMDAKFGLNKGEGE